MKRLLLCLALAAAVLPAAARDTDGVLSLVLRPNCGAPAMAVPGGAFDVLLREAAPVELVSGTKAWRLETAWGAPREGRQPGRCTLPADIPPGRYGIRAAEAERLDTNPGVVHVLESFPDDYVVAQLGGVPTDGADALLRQARDAGAVFAVVTGSAVAEDTPAAWTRAVRTLAEAPLPIYVVPTALGTPAFARYFGPGGHVFRFGLDAYLAFDTTGAPPADAEAAQLAWIYPARRSVRDARWSIGLTRRYGLGMAMRAQITLFVDDPLDAILADAVPTFEDAPLPTAPWGRTALFASGDVPLQLLRIGPTIQRVAPTADTADDTVE